jgi:hypothetical protein
MTHERGRGVGRGRGRALAWLPALAGPGGGSARGLGDHRGVAADKRGNKTLIDLVLSMVVLGVVVAVIFIFIPHGSKADGVKPVSFSVELGQARRDAPYKVAGPQGLSAKWRATSVTYSDTDPKNVTWHLGFVDPDDEYVAVEQSNAPAATFISTVTLKAHRDGTRTVTAGGQVWERYAGDKYNALVRRQSGVTTVVLSTGPDTSITQMAAALQERGGN